MNLRSVKENKNYSQGRKVQAFPEDKENLKRISPKKIKRYEVENGTTKVRKQKFFKRTENEKTPKQKENSKNKKLNEETEKFIREPDSDHSVKNLKLSEVEGKSSTTFTDAEKSEKSTCHKLQKEEDPKPRHARERRLEDLFLKKPPQNFIDKNDFAVDEWYIYEEFLHPLISSPFENNEIEKNKLIHKYLKKPTTQNYKTDSCKTFQFLLNGTGKRNYLELNSMNDQGQPSNKIADQVNFSKKRKVSSCKKVYESVLIFHDSTSKPHYFKVYNDGETGFDSRYNQILKTMEIDNDVDTDEEQLSLAKNFTHDNIRDTIGSFNIKQLKNKIRFKRSRTARPGRRTRLL